MIKSLEISFNTESPVEDWADFSPGAFIFKDKDGYGHQFDFTKSYENGTSYDATSVSIKLEDLDLDAFPDAKNITLTDLLEMEKWEEIYIWHREDNEENHVTEVTNFVIWFDDDTYYEGDYEEINEALIFTITLYQ